MASSREFCVSRLIPAFRDLVMPSEISMTKQYILYKKYSQSDWITASEHAQTRSFATSSHAHFREHDLSPRDFFPSRFMLEYTEDLFKCSRCGDTDITLNCTNLHYIGFSERDGFYGRKYCKRFVEEMFLRSATWRAKYYCKPKPKAESVSDYWGQWLSGELVHKERLGLW